MKFTKLNGLKVQMSKYRPLDQDQLKALEKKFELNMYGLQMLLKVVKSANSKQKQLLNEE